VFPSAVNVLIFNSQNHMVGVRIRIAPYSALLDGRLHSTSALGRHVYIWWVNLL